MLRTRLHGSEVGSHASLGNDGPEVIRPSVVQATQPPVAPDAATFGDARRFGILSRAQFAPKQRPDGHAVLASIIEDLGARAARSETVAMVWDADLTLSNPLPRMLATVHAYGRTDVQLDEVHADWRETARALGLNEERFYAFWNDYYWRPESFAFDGEITETTQLARRAQELGIHIIISTGRDEGLRDATEAQLARFGIYPTKIFMKREGLKTPESKGEDMLELKAMGYHLGAFTTDRADEIQGAMARAQDAVSELQHVLVDLVRGKQDASALPLSVALLRVDKSAY